MSIAVLGLVLALLPAARAAPTVHLGAATVAAVRGDGAGPGVAGRLVFAGARFGLEGGIRESAVGVVDDLGSVGLEGSDGTFIGNIHLVGRFNLGPVVLRGGLAHHHETRAPLVGRDPVRTTAGTHPGITHLSGFELGLERLWSLESLGGRWGERLELSTALASDWMPGAAHNRWTTHLELGLRMRLGA